MRISMFHHVLGLGTLLLGAAAPSCLAATTNLITNGGFESTYSTGTQSATTPSQLNYNGYGVTGWTSSPNNAYNFVFNPTLAGSAGYFSNGQYGTIQLYTSQNGGSATAPASLVSPRGGNFLAMDGAFQAGPVSQTVNSLTVGGNYLLSFFWAASQQEGFTGVTTESLGVTFGNQFFSTPTVTNPSLGFTPWSQVSYEFQATSTSQTLSFLAFSGPSGAQAPFALLDGVSLTAVTPEPSSFVLLATGLLGVGKVVQRRRSLT